MLDALGHPLRRDLLRLTFRHPRITIRRASRDLHEQLGNVRYHMSSLKQAGLVAPVDRKAEKGSFATLWSSTERGEVAIAILETIETRGGR
jgi:DNA-binding transcriptional ArsR family regulator